MIEVEDLTKSYGSVMALRGISFQVKKGEICGLLGPNGAGKSTTIKILSGYLEPDAGSRRINGFDMAVHPREAKQQIGYVPETPILYREMLVREYLGYVARLKGVPRTARRAKLEQVVQQCGLAPVLKKPIGAVSKGYRQRTALAQALINDPAVLLLDEPTSALDPLQVLEIRTFIRSLARERTILFCTHILQEATACCDRVLILNNGTVAAEAELPMETKTLEDFLVQSVRGAA